ncbi:MAG TPA: type II secretion system protein GspG [Pseudomonas sp.]|nr:type II secretion system protein GspG [Pseudomonas sp.]
MSTTLANNSGMKGVSLVEASVWGLSILVGIAVGTVLYNRRVTDEVVLLSKARENVRALGAALLMPRPQDRALPSTAEGLAALVDDGTLAHIPNDPWGRPYVFRNPGTDRNYDLLSLGPDGVESQDDIVIWDLYGKRAAVSQGGAGNRPRPAATTPGADKR